MSQENAMDPSDVAFVKGAITLVLVAGTGLTGFWLWLRARGKGQVELNRVVDGVREENAQFQAELGRRMVELEERLDFAERLLSQQQQEPSLPEPRVPTPV
jgi:hypothetical protein